MPPPAAGPRAEAAEADTEMLAAWQRHTGERRTALQLDAAAGYIDVDTCAQRLDALARCPDLTAAKATQAEARRRGAATDPEGLATELALLLQDCRVPDRIPRSGDVALVMQWQGPQSAPELADDALVLGHRQSDVTGGTQHHFWVQWQDDKGQPAGYRLTLTRPDPLEGFDFGDNDETRLDMEIAPLEGGNG